MTPEPADSCGSGERSPKKRRKYGSRAKGLFSSGDRLMTEILTTDGVTGSSSGASDGTPSRVAKAGIAAPQRVEAASRAAQTNERSMSNIRGF